MFFIQHGAAVIAMFLLSANVAIVTISTTAAITIAIIIALIVALAIPFNVALPIILLALVYPCHGITI